MSKSFVCKKQNPIWYKNKEDIKKSPIELSNEIRDELCILRGKIGDIVSAYGWEDRFEHLQGGLTCVISSMYHTIQELEVYDKRFNKIKESEDK